MSTGFQAVQWNRAKIVYDITLAAGVTLYIGGYMALARALAAPGKMPGWDDLRIQAFGSCAFFMISLILAIGPLARLNPRLLPLLYNRRHFGLFAFCIAAMHGYFVVDWFALRGALPDFWGEITTAANYSKFIGITIKPLGMVALLIFFVMAATSHDYWLSVLTPPFWKALHMPVYAAYGLIIMHVALGLMQHDYSPAIPLILGATSGLVALLHILSGLKERTTDAGLAPDQDGWIAVGPPDSISDKRAKIVAAPGGERIAVFRDGARIGAVSNLCAHQNGPVGEGEIIDGCITCPWHGWQYRLEDGRSPPPFKEELATYRVRLREGRIEVHAEPLPPGTPASLVVPA